MKKALLVLCVVFVSGVILAQDFSRAEVYGGYSYMNIDTNGLTDRLNANGWEAGGVAFVNRTFGIEGNVAGYYNTKNISGIDINSSAYSYTGGPYVRLKPVFIHALFGGDHLKGSALGISDSQNGFAMALGGGVEVPTSSGFGLRASVDYALSHHNVIGGNRVDQNNVRVGVGIFYAFGATNHTASSVGRVRRLETSEVVARLRLSGRQTPNGFWIEKMDPASALVGTGATENDVIVAVNGRSVSSAAQIEALLPQSGEVTLTVLLGRLATKDLKIVMPAK
jgi:hypothetical protein